LSGYVAGSGYDCRIYLDGNAEMSYATCTNVSFGNGRIGATGNDVSCYIAVDDVVMSATPGTGDPGDHRCYRADIDGEGYYQDKQASSEWQVDSGGVAVYTAIDETVFTNASPYNWCEALGSTMYRYSTTLQNCSTVGLAGGDTVVCVVHQYLYETDGGGASDYTQLQYDGTTLDEAYIADPKTPTFLSVIHDHDATGNDWTQSAFDSTEIGMGCEDANKDLWWYSGCAIVVIEPAAGATHQLAGSHAYTLTASDTTSLNETVALAGADTDLIEAVANARLQATLALAGADTDYLESTASARLDATKPLAGADTDMALAAASATLLKKIPLAGADTAMSLDAANASLNVTRGLSGTTAYTESVADASLPVTQALAGADTDYIETVANARLQGTIALAGADTDFLESVASARLDATKPLAGADTGYALTVASATLRIVKKLAGADTDLVCGVAAASLNATKSLAGRISCQRPIGCEQAAGWERYRLRIGHDRRTDCQRQRATGGHLRYGDQRRRCPID
jgi:hypothetical protein